MRRILLIDSNPDKAPDPGELKANFRDAWIIQFASSGREALQMLKDADFDAVVSELVLEDTTGPELLRNIQKRNPGALRIILTDHNDRDLVYKAINVGHRYVAKPCPTAILCKIIENSLGLRQLLANEELHIRIATIDMLPSPPEIYNKLVDELGNENTNPRRIADLIKKDVAITAKILQMTNSAYFGLPSHIESILQAVNYLGLDTIRSLVLAAGVFSQFHDADVPGFSIDSIYSRSLQVGTGSRHIANAFGFQSRLTDDALMAGMLHDVGKLVMLLHFQDELKEAVRVSKTKVIPMHEAQREILGVTDADIGAHLLSMWGLPDTILEAVALHYTPSLAPSPILNVLTTVHLAFAIEYDQCNKIRDESKSAVDKTYVTKLGLAEQLPSLRSFCTAAIA